MFFIGSLAAILVASQGALAVGSPFGFATGTTGGSSAAPATPTSTSQLASWLSDSTTRTILLDRTYDFTDTEGSVTGPGCKPWACSPNPQQSLDGNGWCSSTAPKTTITYKKAGTTALAVGSNKTILGKGNSGWIKGKGLRLAGSKNVIIQNIRISDINPQYVWVGMRLIFLVLPTFGLITTTLKALAVNSSFRTLNRTPKLPFLTTTLMDNRPGPPAAIHHYWAFLLLGKNDQITFARNYVYFTSGRGPHIGGTSGNKQLMHMYNNYFNDITGHALDADVGGTVLAEGNYFNKVKTPSTGNVNGAVFAPTSATMANQCSTSLGRKCVLNTLGGGSGALTNTAKNSIVSQFTASVVKSASIMDPSTVASYVLANAGTGKVN
ncbi:Pectate lyase [Rhizoctonia solani]|uniref:pectin lyase n=1 Tax=Rhizoctonia solani TaxID=456999 RepID=A0A8H7I3Z3_9AGAM|nr:Pectate lyase [Rhizoctonia solani]